MISRKPWSPKSESCANCSTSERAHAGRGYCTICRRILRKLESARSWDLANPKSLEGFPFKTSYGLDSRSFARFKTKAIRHYEHRLAYLQSRGKKLKDGHIDGLDLEYAFGHIAILAGSNNRSLFHGLCGWFETTFGLEQRRSLLSQLDKIEKEVYHDIPIASLLMKPD